MYPSQRWKCFSFLLYSTLFSFYSRLYNIPPIRIHTPVFYYIEHIIVSSINYCTVLYGLLQVSWIRHRDVHILTVGSYTYTSDQRFQATYHKDTDDWTLQIKWAQKRDAGMYECQVVTCFFFGAYHFDHSIDLNLNIFFCLIRRYPQYRSVAFSLI